MDRLDSTMHFNSMLSVRTNGLPAGFSKAQTTEGINMVKTEKYNGWINGI